MTTLAITPNWKSKGAKFKGTVAAGEHVSITIQNDDGEGGEFIDDASTLRLRVVDPCNGRTLAIFPEPVPEGETPEEWDSDLSPLRCTLNLNTVQMLKAVPPAANVPLLFVLDDYENKTLYFKELFPVEHWPRLRGEEEPTDLDNYKDIIADFNTRLDGYGTRITGAENAAQAATANASAAAAEANQAVGIANQAVDKAETAQNSAAASAAAAHDSALAAKEAQEAAESAAESINSPDATLTEEGVAADAKATGDAIAAEESRAIAAEAAEETRAKGIESGLRTDLTAAQKAIDDEAQLRVAADADLNANKADKATTYTKTEVDTKIGGFVDGAEYDSDEKKILFKHGATTVAEIDATDFIKDGMVSDVYIGTGADDGKLVIVFNSDAGHQTIKIPLTSIFNPANYYDKDAADAKFVAKVQGMGLSSNDFTTEYKNRVDNVYDAVVEYIEGTGSQYIDTGLVQSADTKYTVKIAPLKSGNCAVGCGPEEGYSYGWRLSFHSAGIFQDWAARISCPAPDFTHVYEATVERGKLVLSDLTAETTNTYTGTQSSTHTPSSHMFLFANPDISGAMGSLRLYYIKIWQGGELVRDMVPVKASGVGCLYDRVTKRLFVNGGTGAFGVGSVVEASPADRRATALDLAAVVAQVASGYKPLQTAVSDPTASGAAPEFIASITQNANGVITVTKKKVQNVVSVTWSALKALRDGGNLVPGRQYRITDYVATTNGNMSSQSANHPFDLVVTADSAGKLNEKARAVVHETVLDFAEGAQYTVGDFCKYDGTVYKCTTAHQGEWNAGDFMEKSPYFSGCNLAAWEVWYCLDNDMARFAWALDDEENETDSQTHTGGRGIVYRLIDEFQNDVPYDFKGIKFLANGDADNVYRYTFDSGAATGNTDLSLDGGRYASRVHNNIIGVAFSSGNGNGYRAILNCIVFKGAGCNCNIFGKNCTGNTFGANCRSNIFENDCRANTFGGGCYDNLFGVYNVSNIFGDSFTFNKTGNYCTGNRFGSSCYANSLGSYCSGNFLGDYCYFNSFGNDCNRNVLGNYCDSNIFENDCEFNVFGAKPVDFSTETTYHPGDYVFYDRSIFRCTIEHTGDWGTWDEWDDEPAHFVEDPLAIASAYYRRIKLENGVKDIFLDCTGTRGSGVYFQNVTVASSVEGTMYIPKVIQNANSPWDFKTTYQPASSQIVRV